MKTEYEMVKEFMQTFGQECPSEFVVPSESTRNLRDSLFSEEHTELKDAKDKVAYLDAVCDKLYVTRGDAVAAGIKPEKLELAFAEVHRSNMSKLWTHEEVMADSRCLAGEVKISFVTTAPNPRQFLVQRRDGKVLKSPSYSPAQLEQFCQ